MVDFIKFNLISFVIVFISRWIIVPFDHIDISIANYVGWLPTGSTIIVTLLFGFSRSFYGILAALLLVAGINKGFVWDPYQFSYIGKVIDSFAPIASIMIMRAFQLSTFFDAGKINHKHVIFLVILTSIMATIPKIFIYPLGGKVIADSVAFMTSYITSDILGGMVFIYVFYVLFKSTLTRRNLI